LVPSPHRQDRDNASANNTVQTHQKSFNKRGNLNPSSNGGHLAPQTSGPQGPMAPAGSHNYNSSLKEHQPRAGFVPNDHPPQRNSFRHRNGGGPHQRGDGHHHNYGGRRDHDRGNQDWSNHRNFNGRDNYMSPRFVPRFIRPPPPNLAQLYPPPPAMRPPYGSIGYPGTCNVQMICFIVYVHGLIIVCICRTTSSDVICSTSTPGINERCPLCLPNTT